MTPVERRPDAAAVAYIRRSVEHRRPEDRDDGAGQRAEIAQLAERKGDTIALVYAGDWGISGRREKLDKRQDMLAILAGIKAGAISALYAYAVDRLARDDAFGLKLRDACEDAGVLVHTKLDGSFDFSDDRDRDYWTRKVTDAANMGRRYTKVNLDSKAEARRHFETCAKPGRPHSGRCDSRCIPGEHCAYKHDLGGKLRYGQDPNRPDEKAEAIVAIYRVEGSYLGTCRALNEGFDAGTATWRPGSHPTRHGKPWDPRSVYLVIRDNAPALTRPQVARRGVSARQTHLFSGLLTCPYDGATMIAFRRPGRVRGDGTIGPASAAYICRTAHLSGSHHPLMVSEPKVLRWAKVEVMRAPGVRRVPVETGRRDPETGEHLPGAARVTVSPATIAAKRAAIADAVIDGLITREESRRRLAKLDAQSKGAETAQRAWTILGAASGMDWNREPAEVNADLRTIWSEVKLGPDMLPFKAEWIVSPYAGPDDVDTGEPYGGRDDKESGQDG